MPNAKMDALNDKSGDEQVREAISSEIEQCMNTPPPSGTDNHQKYCAGKAYGMAREKTGKQLGG